MTSSVPSPLWLTNLQVRNKLEHNISVMQLHSLFQRYLRECNYVEDLDTTDVIQQLALQTFKPVPYGYADIPQLYPDDVSMLLQKRNDGCITQMEEAQLEKYCFQNLILDVNPKVKSVLWDLYIHQGRWKFRNLSFERALDEGTITVQAIKRTDRYAYRTLNDAFSLQCQIIQDIKGVLGIHHSHDFNSLIPSDKLRLLSRYLQQHEQRTRTAFGLRSRRTPRQSTPKVPLATPQRC